jgi:hypothetical protein
MGAGPGRERACGGILGRRWVDALAVAASVGIDPVAIIRADPLVRELMLDVIEAGVRRQIERDEALARRIIAAYADALKRSR